MEASSRFPESARVGASWQLVPTESRITLEPKGEALRVITLRAEEKALRVTLEKPTNPKSILCAVPPHTGAQNRAEKPIFK